MAPVVACAAMAAVDVSTAVGAGTGIVSAAPATAAGGYPVCDVKGVIAPQIQFEVQLPTQTYRQRYLQAGCGGLCGSLAISAPAAAGCAPLSGGAFATASNNQGHVGGGSADGNFGTDRALRIDFAYRADHLTALAAKALITAFYGHAPRYSYFDGCSQGGHEALTEAQRYPHDFDGILAGAPASITTELNGFNQPWLARVDFDTAGRVILPASKLPALHAAVMARCDSLDGLVDGQLDDPRRCSFDPATLTCPAGTDNGGCLTPAQVTVLRKIYSGAVDTGGRQLAEVDRVARAYAARVMVTRMRADSMERWSWHLRAGHCLVIASASPGLYVHHLGRLLGADDVICTEMAVVNGRLTGALAGRNCRGEEKARRVIAHLTDQPSSHVWAYSDGDADRPLLAIAYVGIRVTPYRRLARWENR